jgi:hypothetical protein
VRACVRACVVVLGGWGLRGQGPFTYEALAPGEITFVPLNQTETMDGNQLMAFYEKARWRGGEGAEGAKGTNGGGLMSCRHTS